MVVSNIMLLALPSIFQKQRYGVDAMPLISIIFLLEQGIPINIWFVIIVTCVSILMISFGTVIRENVRRMPRRGHQFVRNYQQYFKNWKNLRKKGLQEVWRIMKVAPLPSRVMKIYLIIIPFHLFIYIWLMIFTVIQGRPETWVLFVLQLSVLLWAYVSTFVRVFGKLQL